MRLHKQLRRSLPKIPDLVLDGFPHHLILNRVQVDAPLVSQIIEAIRRPYRLGAFLLVPEDQIYPLMQLAGHEFGFQRHPVDPHELFRGAGPGRELRVSYGFPVLVQAQSVPVGVDEHFGEEIELGDQLLHVRSVPLAVLPR